MPQSTNSPSSPAVKPKAITDADIVALSSSSTTQQIGKVIGSVQYVERCENDGEKAPDRPATPCKTPQAWEPEEPDFDFTAVPGAEDWQIGETADGRAVYSTVGAGVTIEFQKWDW